MVTPWLPLPALGLATTGKSQSGQGLGAGTFMRAKSWSDFNLDDDIK